MTFVTGKVVIEGGNPTASCHEISCHSTSSKDEEERESQGGKKGERGALPYSRLPHYPTFSPS